MNTNIEIRQSTAEEDKILQEWAITEWGIDSALCFSSKLIAYVAVCYTEIVGCALLSMDDLPSRSDLTPWLASVFVKPEYRGCNVASALVHRVEVTAKGLGFKDIWLITESAEGLYKKYNWSTIEKVDHNNTKLCLMRKTLGA